jgi:hypothetical protein
MSVQVEMGQIATVVMGGERGNTAERDLQSFRFFEGLDSQKQPETVQKVDLMLRDVNPGRNELTSTNSWGEGREETGQEAGWT